MNKKTLVAVLVCILTFGSSFTSVYALDSSGLIGGDVTSYKGANNPPVCEGSDKRLNYNGKKWSCNVVAAAAKAAPAAKTKQYKTAGFDGGQGGCTGGWKMVPGSRVITRGGIISAGLVTCYR